jgi:hypothetical protein
MFFAVILAVMFLIMGNIDIVVPFIANEIDGSPASIIFTAVLAPFLLMARRYMHVDRLINDSGRRRLNHDGFCVNKLGLRGVSDVNAAIKAGLADADRHSDLGCLS